MKNEGKDKSPLQPPPTGGGCETERLTAKTLGLYSSPQLGGEERGFEFHPLRPFLPQGCRLLMLGSFPPARKRWAMDFFYPNFINDMWRIFGICFFGDKQHFVDEPRRTFRRQEIEQLLTEQGIGLFDTATAIRRTKNTASDKDLEVVQPTDLTALLQQIPQCQAVCTTGQKATDLFCAHFGIQQPTVGGYVDFSFEGRTLRHYRMPSSSRAYPMKVERKAETYRGMFAEVLPAFPSSDNYHPSPITE